MEGSGSSKLKFHNNCRTTAIFEKLEQVGAGTYGQVWRARERDLPDSEIVALKRIRMETENEGFPITAIREIKILNQLSTVDSIIKLKEVVVSSEKEVEDGNAVYLVFEFMDHDLSGLLDSDGFKGIMSLAQIKGYMKQLLTGLLYLHTANIIHRDIKTANLLVNNKGQLKLADFGLARPLLSAQSKGKYTNRVITLWYRPPELLLGDVHYGPAIDMWSAGCVLAELLDKRSPFQQSKIESEQIDLIWRLVGSPTSESWPEAENLPLYSTMKPKRNFPPQLKNKYAIHGEETVGLLEGLLCLNPNKRFTAEAALDHEFFFVDPLPLEPHQIPVYHVSSHEFTAKRRKKEKQELQQQHNQYQQQQNQFNNNFNYNNNNNNHYNNGHHNNDQHANKRPKTHDTRDQNNNNNFHNNNNNQGYYPQNAQNRPNMQYNNNNNNNVHAGDSNLVNNNYNYNNKNHSGQYNMPQNNNTAHNNNFNNKIHNSNNNNNNNHTTHLHNNNNQYQIYNKNNYNNNNIMNNNPPIITPDDRDNLKSDDLVYLALKSSQQ